jgi:hypothetical protein
MITKILIEIDITKVVTLIEELPVICHKNYSFEGVCLNFFSRITLPLTRRTTTLPLKGNVLHEDTTPPPHVFLFYINLTDKANRNQTPQQ